MSTLYSPEQIAQHVIERRMGSATAEDLEALAYGYQRLSNHYEQAKVDLDSARNELGLIVAASLLADGETIVEPAGPRGAALSAMLNTAHRAHEAERAAPLCCECQRIATCIGTSEAGIQCLCDDCCGHGQEDSSCVPISDVEEWVRKRDDQLGKELLELEQRAESAELGCDIAYKREPTAEEGDAYEFEHHQSMGPVEKSGECHVPMGDWHGHRCTCGKWVWGGGTVCQGCVDAQAVRLAVSDRDSARAEVAELRARVESAEEIAERGASIAGNTGSVKAMWGDHRSRYPQKVK